MILLVNSGATKADWIALDKNGENLFTTQTQGLSPEVASKEEMSRRLNERFDIVQNKDAVNEIYFYGAGCGTENLKAIVKQTLEEFFPNLQKIIVEEDTYGAVFATTAVGTKAIVCILGTGSNCSYYDGQILQQKAPSLGFLLMDHCSGNKIGGELILHYNFNTLPIELCVELEKEYDMDINNVKDTLYKKPNPNAYLATFAKFAIQNKEHPFIQKIVDQQIQYFIDYYIKQYDNHKELPINFSGSIAFYLQDDLKKKLVEKKLNIGTIVRRPIDGLVKHIINNELNLGSL